MLTIINNAIVINKKASKISKYFVLQVAFLSSKFVGTVFVGTVFVVFIIQSHVITELSAILAKYLLFLQLHVAGLEI